MSFEGIVNNELTTIYFSMRMNKEYAEQLNISDFEDKSLLILDDDDPLRGRLSRAMEKERFSVKEAKSVSEAMQIVQKYTP